MRVKFIELYNTIQGEGAWMGRPVTLVRLAGCSNKCPFCDTKQSWNDNSEIDYLDLVNDINKLIRITGRLLITGGEPLEQYNIVNKLATDYCDYEIGIETSGNYVYTDLRDSIDVITISPKKHNFALEKLEKWEDGGLYTVNYKFVIGNNSWSLDEVLDIIEKLNINYDRVWLMSETDNGNFNSKLCQEVWEFCTKYGMNYSDRLHCRIFGNKNGV